MDNISKEEKFFITELLKENIELLKENYTFDKMQKETLAKEIEYGLNIIEEQDKQLEEQINKNIKLTVENQNRLYENFIMDRMINKMSEEILKLDRIRASHEYDKPRIWETEKGIKEYFRKKVE
jgi:hypothetical protein